MKGRERGMATRTGINKQGWESSDFPVACDSCYGENPFMRMLKENYGQQCRICFRPFTVFKWKGNRGVYKRTCVCQSCSKDKNICQVCTLDLEFGLPIDIRDKRCGQNGKYLLNQNFLSEQNSKIKPPLPNLPPPIKNKISEKELVYIPKKGGSEDEAEEEKEIDNNNKVEKESGSDNKVEKESGSDNKVEQESGNKLGRSGGQRGEQKENELIQSHEKVDF